MAEPPIAYLAKKPAIMLTVGLERGARWTEEVSRAVCARQTAPTSPGKDQSAAQTARPTKTNAHCWRLNVKATQTWTCSTRESARKRAVTSCAPAAPHASWTRRITRIVWRVIGFVPRWRRPNSTCVETTGSSTPARATWEELPVSWVDPSEWLMRGNASRPSRVRTSSAVQGRSVYGMLGWAEAAVRCVTRPVRRVGRTRRCVPVTTPHIPVNVPWSRLPALWGCCWKSSTLDLATVSKQQQRKIWKEQNKTPPASLSPSKRQYSMLLPLMINLPESAPPSSHLSQKSPHPSASTIKHRLSKQKGLGNRGTCMMLSLLLAFSLVFLFFPFFCKTKNRKVNDKAWVYNSRLDSRVCEKLI